MLSCKYHTKAATFGWIWGLLLEFCVIPLIGCVRRDDTDRETVMHSSSYDLARYIEEGVVASDSDRLFILAEKWVPPVGFKFPTTGGQKYNPL